MPSLNNGFHVALIIPTGIGASIGGFGGDAMTLLPLLASVCDMVVTHPNVANAACFQTLPGNVLYVEGYALDRFFEGRWHLQPIRQNRVGVILDAGIPPDMEMLHRNTIQAVETVYGVAINGTEKTEMPVSLEIVIGESGRSTGRINNPEVLLAAGQRLIDSGTEAIAVCCLMPEVPRSDLEADYQSGQGVDPIAGLEAMISHWMVSQLELPVAHAPVFDWETAQPVTDKLLDPRSASEFIVSTFLPCVLTGLAKAPQYTTAPSSGSLDITALSALIVPADALGSVPVFAALERKIPVLAVENNETVMAATAEALNIPQNSIIPCRTYLDALGHLIALKEGITVPQHMLGQVLREDVLLPV